MGGITRLLLWLWAGVTVSAEVDLQKRIIGGRDCDDHDRQYHVRLEISNGTHSSLCGGSLISNRWILTAAHCWEQGWTLTAVLGRHPHPVERMQIKEKTVIFKDRMNDSIHDIMLLKLPNPTNIQPVGLPDCRNRPKINATVQIAGHAATATGPNQERQYNVSYTLQCANIAVVDCQRLRDCVKKYNPTYYDTISFQHFNCCQSPGVDISHGDSGGGVVHNGSIYGVISFTGNATHACTEAAAFMDVCGYMDWIERTIAGRMTKFLKAMKCLWCFKHFS